MLSETNVTAGAGAARSKVSAAARTGGTSQVDRLLSDYVGDAGPGDVDGQWFVVSADGTLIKTNPN